MALNGSQKDAIQHRREQVARLRLRGLTVREICVALTQLPEPITGKDNKPLNVATIHGDLKKLDAEWRERAAEAIDARKARQLAEIDEAKRKAWQASDLQALARFLKLESDIFGTMAAKEVKLKTWQDEIVALLRDGKLTPELVTEELGSDLAAELFIAAGVPVSQG